MFTFVARISQKRKERKNGQREEAKIEDWVCFLVIHVVLL